jgi:hypothetical protein
MRLSRFYYGQLKLVDFRPFEQPLRKEKSDSTGDRTWCNLIFVFFTLSYRTKIKRHIRIAPKKSNEQDISLVIVISETYSS